MPRHREKVPSFRAADLRAFIEYECEGDLTRLPIKVRHKYDSLKLQELIYFYTADELLLAMDSHLRFFEDWLNDEGRTDQGT